MIEDYAGNRTDTDLRRGNYLIVMKKRKGQVFIKNERIMKLL